ncbi:NADH-quinone oxidoreductase subunit C [Mariprofundus sp. KV]|uniref:NADH-quinone oxidoreductase subunit C n=1 Tax=Mariprofundus sp. KV TaxID=2608715 RepID=UPI0015A45B6A|nr:NADH-quinone oxidoreductase subunit C [Mariprofundus sp. KV]NWF35904.1 NADH-quinone oxidoreductase subunit C [Mariprofundus sp. KV]
MTDEKLQDDIGVAAATDVSPEVKGLREKFGDQVLSVVSALDCEVVTLAREAIADAGHYLKNEHRYEQMMDLCGVDNSELPGWSDAAPRFEVVYNLLSISRNCRIRLKVGANERDLVDSVTEVWPTANWFEREAFDMYGIIFNNHPDLRRILTDYGFEGYPLRKDFPMTGRVEMFFDDAQWRCVYRPNQLEERILIQRTWPGVDRG